MRSMRDRGGLVPAGMSVSVRGGLAVYLAAGVLAGPASADEPMLTLCLDFNASGSFKESDGEEGTAERSNLSEDEQDSVVEKVQEIFDDVGERKVEVKSGSGDECDVTMIITSGEVADEEKYGNAGEAGGPGVVYEDQIDDDHRGDALVNAIANVAAHEAGHKLGLGHNWDDRPSTMTAGPKWEEDEVGGSGTGFNDDDLEDLKEEICDEPEEDAEHKDDFCGADVGVYPGDVLDPQSPFFEEYLDVVIEPVTVPPQAEIGYVSNDGAFVSTFDPEDEQISVMTFPYHAGADVGVSVDGLVSSLCGGEGYYELSNPNPFNPGMLMTADVTIDTPLGPASFRLQVLMAEGPHTGGFFVPEQSCAADFNGDGVLDALDFVAFEKAFEAGDASADCDGDGVLSVMDFVCFQRLFEAGC